MNRVQPRPDRSEPRTESAEQGALNILNAPLKCVPSTSSTPPHSSTRPQTRIQECPQCPRSPLDVPSTRHQTRPRCAFNAPSMRPQRSLDAPSTLPQRALDAPSNAPSSVPSTAQTRSLDAPSTRSRTRPQCALNAPSMRPQTRPRRALDAPSHAPSMRPRCAFTRAFDAPSNAPSNAHSRAPSTFSEASPDAPSNTPSSISSNALKCAFKGTLDTSPRRAFKRARHPQTHPLNVRSTPSNASPQCAIKCALNALTTRKISNSFLRLN